MSENKSTYLLKRYLLEKTYEEKRCSLTDTGCESYIKKLLGNEEVKKYNIDEETMKILKLNKNVPFVFSGEVYLQELLYQKLQNGEISFDEKDFNNWLNSLIKNKIKFGEYLKEYHTFENCKKIVEISESEHISTSIIIPSIERQVILSPVGDGCNTSISNQYNDGHLLINGMFDNEIIYLMKAISNGSFTVGYCGKEDSLYTERVYKYYKKLYRRLLKMFGEKFPVKLTNDTLNSDKILVLSYNSTFSK